MRLVKRIIAIACTTMLMLSLTGCDANTATFAADTKRALTDRMTLNMKCLEKLKVSGLISTIQYDGMQKNLQEVSDRLAKISLDSGNDALTEIGNACVWWLKVKDADTEIGETEKSFVTEFGTMQNAMAKNAYDVSETRHGTEHIINDAETAKLANHLEVLMGMESADASMGIGQIKPIEILNSTHLKEFNEMLNYEVWVLKEGTDGKLQTMDAIKAAVKEATGQGTGASNSGNVNVPLLLQNYFKNSNKAFIDYTNTTRNLPIQYSKANGNIQTPGSDLVLTQTVSESKKLSRTQNVMTVRFLEFNEEVVDKLTGTAGGVGQKYIVVPGTSGQTGRIYLLEYPVSVVDTITYNEANGKIKTTFKETKLKINLLNDTLINDITLTEQGEPKYINTGTIANPYKDGNAAFGIYGSLNTQVVFGAGNKANADVGRVVLRDYLEYSLMPGVHATENVVALGRKVRILHFDGSAKDQFACYVDAYGNNIANSTKIYARDIMDIAKASNTPMRSKLNIDTAETEPTDTGDPLGTGLETIPLEYAASVKPVDMFAGNMVDTTDKSSTINTSKMLYWGIALDVNPFDSKLYSDWMDKKSDTAGLNWWLGYIKAQGYTYSFETGDIQEFFKGNYNFNAADDGFVQIDLGAVAKIQDDYAKQADLGAVSWIRTTFVLIGFILLGWSMVLMGCWAIDTNIDGGFNTLQKASCGRWIAVKYADEIPNSRGTDGEMYLTFAKMFMKVLVVIAMGILLISVDVVQLVVMIIQAFGGIASMISKKIFGL